MKKGKTAWRMVKTRYFIAHQRAEPVEYINNIKVHHGMRGWSGVGKPAPFLRFFAFGGAKRESKAKILIADDSVMNQQMLTEILGDS